jgi:ParB/RepB/Spo0J family partition protein
MTITTTKNSFNLEIIVDKKMFIENEIIRKIKNVTYEDVDISDIDPDISVDVRVNREVESIEVIESIKKKFYNNISPLIVQKIENVYGIVDGKTRYIALVEIKYVGKVRVLVIPETLTEDEKIFLDILLNTKRKNLSDGERVIRVEFLHKMGYTVSQISEITLFSKKDIQLKLNLTDFPEQVKYNIDSKIGLSTRKIQEAVGDDFYKKVQITEKLTKDLVDQTVICMIDKVKKEDANRDLLSTKKISKIFQKNVNTMLPKNFTPEDVVEASYATMDGKDKSDNICQHPSKLDFLEQYLIENNSSFFINLFCESYLYDKDGNDVESAISRASKIIGGENCDGVGFFEGIKYKYAQNYVQNYNTNIHKEDLYVWLSKQNKKEGNGVIFVDSFGTHEYNSLPFLTYLKSKYPGSTIFFLMLDQSGFRNCTPEFNAKNYIVNWGIDPVNSVEDFVKVQGNLEIVWFECVQGGNMYMLKY